MDVKRSACWLLCLLLGMGWLSAQAEARKRGKRIYYVWEDRSDGMSSLFATYIESDPRNRKWMYAAVDGVFYRSKDGGQTWWPTVRFSGSSRVLVSSADLSQVLRRLRDQILEARLEELAAEIGEDAAQDQADTLEREAEELAEDLLRQRLRARARSSRGRGRFSRYIYHIKVFPKDSKKILVATDGGLFFSKDRGKTFRSIFRGRGAGTGDVRRIAIDAQNAKKIWLGTRLGLWRSQNGGRTWQRYGGQLRSLKIVEVQIDPNDPKIMYVATPRALFVSKDRGRTFLRRWSTSSNLQQISAMAVLATTPATLALGTKSGLYLAKANRLKSFRRSISRGISRQRILFLTSTPKAPRSLYVITQQGVFVSKDLGRKFRHLQAGMMSTTIRSISVSPHDADAVWAATGYGVMRWSKLVGRHITKAQWNRFRRKLRREPSVWRTAQAALRYMSLNFNLSTITGRQGFRTLLPKLDIRAWYIIDSRSIGLSLINNQVQAISIAEGRIFMVAALLRWDFGAPLSSTNRITSIENVDRMLNKFGAPVNGSAVATGLRKTRDKLIKNVNRLYHARRRLQLRLFVSPPNTVRKAARMLLKLEEITAQLDAMTGSYLSRKLKALR